ncbi:hypothetical protein SAY87_009322 [Trapa incisa]|uniref:Dihydrolipoamide acetyltransferase component of pyruvate dehydrogenase complex n=1 Tax=Trapa incisa TaxID=236973 RepID=A0AAN7JUT4_9MYRT|nr:hypothetical protein SAY87_009322 [Trapa incisa]
MITRRSFQERQLVSAARRLLFPQFSLAPVPPSSEFPAALQFYSPLSCSPSATETLSSIGSRVRSNYQYTLMRFWSSGNALEDPFCGGLIDVPLAQTGEGIAECELLKWYVKEGDQVEEFQPLCEVQSDKATIEITSRYKGKVIQILHAPSDIVKVGETLLKMTVKGFQLEQDVHDGLESINSPSSVTSKSRNCGILSTPAVRNLAREYAIDIANVHGTGKDGRVLKEDVLKYALEKGILERPPLDVAGMQHHNLEGLNNQQSETAKPEYQLNDETIPLRGYKRAMVKSMSMAATVPHFYYVDEMNCDALVKFKTAFQQSNSDPNVKHTFLPLLIKSLSMALSKYPMMNSCFNEKSMEVILKGSHNIGIAMATPNGLVVPTIKNVQSLSILEITKELMRLQKSALDNKLTPDDISGGTITLSNIGAIGGKSGSPLLNLPEVSIIAIGRIQKATQISEDGNAYAVSIMTVNIGADHRVLDGATVATFCNQWKQYIEKPELLMLHMK